MVDYYILMGLLAGIVGMALYLLLRMHWESDAMESERLVRELTVQANTRRKL